MGSLLHTDVMSETQQLIKRIRSVAKLTQRATATVSGQVLGTGQGLANLEAGKTITLAKYERAMAELDRMERAARSEQAA